MNCFQYKFFICEKSNIHKAQNHPFVFLTNSD